MIASVPCRGSAPIENSSISAVQRDCSPPDLEKLFDSEPWVLPKGVTSEKQTK